MSNIEKKLRIAIDMHLERNETLVPFYIDFIEEVILELQTKDTEIERLELDNQLMGAIEKENISYRLQTDPIVYEERIKKQDALIKELIEVVEFYGNKVNWNLDGDIQNMLLDNGVPIRMAIDLDDTEDAHGGKKARTLLNSEAVKKWRKSRKI